MVNCKKVTLLFLIVTMHSYALLGPHMIANSPADFLVDWYLALDDPLTTKQIGNELLQRNYIANFITFDPTVGRYDQRPTSPAIGIYFFRRDMGLDTRFF